MKNKTIFDELTDLHHDFVLRLRIYVSSRGDISLIDEVSSSCGMSHHECNTGQWLMGSGLKYGGTDVYMEFFNAHLVFHRYTDKLIQLIQKKQYYSADVFINSEEFERASKLVLSCIKKMNEGGFL